MKVQFCSDLHLEMRVDDYHLSKTDADVIVLAGDIGVGLKGIHFAMQEASMQQKSVLYVAGNHEFYNHDYNDLLKKMRHAVSDNPLVHFLENDELIIGDTRFLGATLWTDYLGDSSSNKMLNMAYCGTILRDHIVIRKNNKSFTPHDAAAINESSITFLNEKLDEQFTGKTIVITHHAPSLSSQHKYYEYSEVSTAFISNLDELVAKADAWIYGHTHSNLEIKIGKCWLVSNQAGYPSEDIPIPYRPDWVIEI